MSKVIFLVIVLFSSYALTAAQDLKSAEFFGGYSYETIGTGIRSSDIGTTTTLDNRSKLNGFNLSGTAYLKKRFGVTGDFSAHFDTRDDLFGAAATRSKFSLYDITGGPQLRFPGTGRFTPFVQALAGVARHNLTENFTDGTNLFIDHNTSFSMNLGGGLDYRLSDRLAVRIFQLDYNPIFLRSRTVDATVLPSETLNGFRFSTGIVIK